MKKLVAYFSATGTTQALAERLARIADADLYEIEPAEPYTKADLDWTDQQSRSTIEAKVPTMRPAIGSEIPDLASYGVIFIGFPIWWYREPNIIDTFLESGDFSGKTIVPFATSGGSSLGRTADNLKALAPQATVKPGKRFLSSASDQELESFARNLR